jgi:chemotaxis response regulator CheB
MRVALLARAGQARDQLHRALEEAGVLIVAEGDPAELDPRDVAEKLPKVFLVGLEPATEKSIDRFDALFEADGVEVMFDDAEITGKLDGWDLNRWARHLASKLTGSETLPPAPAGAPAIGEGHDETEDAGAMLQPGLPPTPAELMDDAKLEDYTSDSPELADWVPTSPSLTSAKAGDGAEADAGESFSWDGSQDAAGSGEEGEAKEFKLDTDLGIDIDLASLDFAPTPEPAPASSSIRLEDEPIFQEVGEGVRFSSFEDEPAPEQTGDLDADVAALAAQLEAFEKSDTRQAAVDPEFARAAPSEGKGAAAKVELSLDAPTAMPKGASMPADKPAPKAAPAAAVSPSGKGTFDFGNLSLAPIDSEKELEKAPPIEAKFPKASEPAAPPPESSFGELSLSLEGDSPAMPASAPAPSHAAAAAAGGAVLILAGLGGPDAVRQLLSSLPERLSVPVLLYQHLEVGKHERLVEQLAKISKLGVVLAREGESPSAGKVTLLPAGMTAVANGAGLKFAQGNLSQLISALSPADSMVIVLSGADVQLVPMILSVKEEGGTVLAQDPEVCFDAAAAEAMRKEGAAVYPALGLARQVASRWPA